MKEKLKWIQGPYFACESYSCSERTYDAEDLYWIDGKTIVTFHGHELVHKGWYCHECIMDDMSTKDDHKNIDIEDLESLSEFLHTLTFPGSLFVNTDGKFQLKKNE